MMLTLGPQSRNTVAALLDAHREVEYALEHLADDGACEIWFPARTDGEGGTVILRAAIVKRALFEEKQEIEKELAHQSVRIVPETNDA